MDFTSIDDVNLVINHIHYKYPKADIYLVGFSMGAIQAIRWVGEHKGQKIVKGLVSISCPIDLSKASPYLSQKRNWIYAKWMTQALIRIAKHHEELLKEKGVDLDYGKIQNNTRPYISIKHACGIRYQIQHQSVGV